MSAIQDEGTGADEFLDGGFADAAGSAGDQGVTAIETERLGLLPGCERRIF